jgi:hypothetical protein
MLDWVVHIPECNFHFPDNRDLENEIWKLYSGKCIQLLPPEFGSVELRWVTALSIADLPKKIFLVYWPE